MNGRATAEQRGALALDSTQTVRAVTLRELQDANSPKWFAVQLAVSDRPVNLETMPRMDVFESHRLYSIQGRLGTNACYALRLGFFSDQESARTICGDIRALFRFASVVQVSAAEQARFDKARPAEQRSPVQADAAAPKVASPPKSSPPQRAAPPSKPAGSVGERHQLKTLARELLEEARQIELAKRERQTGRQRGARNVSWLSRLLGRSGSSA